MSSTHRSGPLKQENKKHKNEKKRNESKSSDSTRRSSINRRITKIERKATMKQKRSFTASVLKRVLSLRGTYEYPLWCVLVPLTSSVPIHLAKLLFKKCDSDGTAVEEKYDNLQRIIQIGSTVLNKHFSIISANSDDLFGCIDLVQMADWVILVVPSNFSGLDPQTEAFLTTLYAIGLGDVSYAVMSSGASLKEIKLNLASRFPIPENTIYPLNTATHAINLLRHIATSQPGGKSHKLSRSKSIHTTVRSSARNRGKLLAEAISTTNLDGMKTITNSNGAEMFLYIRGILRGTPLYFHEPLEQDAPGYTGPYVHLSGWGDFAVAGAFWTDKNGALQRWSGEDTQRRSSVPANLQKLTTALAGASDDEDTDDSDGTASMSSIQSSTELQTQVDSAVDPPHKQSEPAPPMEVDEELADDDVLFSNYAAKSTTSRGSVFSAEQLAKFRAARMSEMFPDEVEASPNVPARERFNKYRSLPRFQGSVWPVEKDVFPNQYDDIACFKNYHRNIRSILRYVGERNAKSATEPTSHNKFVSPGARVQLAVGPMKPEVANAIVKHHVPGETSESENYTAPPLVLWTLLPHEHRMSVCHFTMSRVTSALRATSDLMVVANAATKTADSLTSDNAILDLGEEASSRIEMEDQLVREALSSHQERTASVRKSAPSAANPLLPPEAEPIKSKELMLFQAGIRRFIGAPIYNTQTTAVLDKAKFEQFFSTTQATVASVYAPVMYSPVNVLQFRVRVDENEHGGLSHPYLGELVATGTLQSSDPERLIIKRVFLSGHPFKIQQRNAVVRFMFFNPLDVEYFKAVSLESKSGAIGHIKEPVGTHGLMKCAFDRPLQASDIVLMPLYKRVFPKWIYQSVIPKVLRARVVKRSEVEWEEAPITLQLQKKTSSSTFGSSGEALMLENGLAIFN